MENKKLIKSVRKLKENSRFVKEAKKIIYPQYVVKNGIDGLAHIEHVTHIGMKIAERECSDTDTDLLGITLGCLLHDIGIRYIDVNYVNTELDDMSSYEVKEYKKHPVYGYSALEKEGWVSDIAKSLILSHHECIDGTGYPMHSRDNYELKQVLAVCDTFDSLICGIGYKRRKVHEAIEYIRYYSGTKYNKKVCDIFLEFIFLYPNGTQVVLNDGRVAKVIRQNKTLKERPVICIEDTNEIIDMMKVKNIFIEKII